MSIDRLIANTSHSLNSFDGSRAREIREKAGLTQDKLARLVGYSGKNPREIIKRIERGDGVPKGIRGTAGIKYLEWLKNEDGYDPFGI